MANMCAYYFMQESIEQAKKSWELSHLQSLREEEERIADEDVDDEMLLTYDRPEASNKVILRRHSSTGMWEVCSPSKISAMDRRTESNSIEDSQASACEDQEQHVKGLIRERRTGNTTMLEEHFIKQISPRTVHIHNQEMLVEEETHTTSNIGKDIDTMKFEHGNGGSSGKLKRIERELKSPRICLSPAIPYTCKFPRSQSSCDVVESNELEHKAEVDSCIGSRTRQRATTQVPSNNHIHYSSQSPVHSSENSPAITHKYPTRHKMTGVS